MGGPSSHRASHQFTCTQMGHLDAAASSRQGTGSSLPGHVISALELIPVVVSATLWGDNWQWKLVCFHSDNEAVVSVLNKGHAQDVALTHLMQCLAFLAAFHGFHFSSVHVPGRLNEAADALSCNNLTLFHSLLRHRHFKSQSSPRQ